jgi:LysM repeat protein
MTNYFDDDSFWDEPASHRSPTSDRTERTNQITRVNHRTERTRSHHVVVRGKTPPPLDYEDPSDEVWLEPAPRFSGLMGRNSERLGVFGNIDPRLLSVGAVAIAAVLAVPLFSAFSGDDGDGGFQSLAEAEATTTTAASTTTAPVEIVITAALNPEIEDGPADTEADTSGDSDQGASSFAATGGAGEEVAALQVPDSCTNRYEVVAGDFWLGIADKADVELDDLLAANGASNATAIYPGSEVCLPDGASIGSGQGNGASGDGATPGGAGAGAVDPATCATTYEIIAGDFWVRIADASGVELHELLEANGANNETMLFPGKTICLPANATPPTQSTAAPTTAAPTTAAPATAPATTNPPTTDPPTTDPPTTQAPETTRPQEPIPSGGEVEALIREIWPNDLEERALEIAWRESNYRPDVTSSTGCCLGVFQMHWEAHQSWLVDMGITSRDQLFDARTNIEAAYTLYQRSGGWGPWSL